MSAKTPNDQTVSDDQELAKVLAGNMSQQKADVNDALGGLQFEESPVPASQGSQTAGSAKSTGASTPTITPSPSAATAAANSSSATSGSSGATTPPATSNSPSSAPANATSSTSATPVASASTSTPSATTTSSAPSLTNLGAAGASAGGASGSLDSIKKDALEELRPLVGKLNLPAEEKFDTLLLIIRSTDDQSLLGPAHDAAKAIQDESRRAQALLDVIKEIDYFSAGQGQA